MCEHNIRSDMGISYSLCVTISASGVIVSVDTDAGVSSGRTDALSGVPSNL